MKTALLLTNSSPGSDQAHATRFATREKMLSERGWNLIYGYLPEPYTAHLPSGRDVLRCYRQLKTRDVDVINSVSEPPQLHVAGYVLHKLTGVPWLVEFRDPLVTKPGRNPSSKTMRLRKYLESVCVRHATQVVWDDGIQIPDGYFETTYPDVPERRYFKLPYLGVHRRLFEGIDPATFKQPTITYAGRWYEGWIEPYGFLDGLSEYLNSPGAVDLSVRIYGDWREEYQQYADSKGVASILKTSGWISHSDIVPILKGSDALLYIGGDDVRNAINIPAKIYDYIGAERPILGVVDPSFRVADVIRENGLGLVAHPDDVEKIREMIESIFDGTYSYDPREGVLEHFSRERRVDAIADVLDTVAEGKMFDPSTDAKRTGQQRA